MNIQFRPITVSDLELLRNHRNKPSTRKWLENESLINEENQKLWFKKGHHSDFLIIKKQDNDVGLARIKKIDADHVQIGMDLFENYRGKGIASDCFQALINKQPQEVKVFELWVFQDNEPALAIYKKAGFKIDILTEAVYLPRSWDKTQKNYSYIKMLLHRI